MLPEPLHPAVVHLPLAHAAQLPPGILLALLALRSGFLPIRAWAVIVVLQVTLGAAAFAALQTGENDEERVEAVVAEAAIETHETRADRFAISAFAAAAISLGGLLRSGWGKAARMTTLAASLVVLVLGIQVGHSGGELVYRHGAGLAYADPPAPENAPIGASVRPGPGSEDE